VCGCFMHACMLVVRMPSASMARFCLQSATARRIRGQSSCGLPVEVLTRSVCLHHQDIWLKHLECCMRRC
jgi:hypothetical protein